MTDNTRIASIVETVGTKYWPTPWAYLLEAGHFQIDLYENGRAIDQRLVGEGRGVNIHIPNIPSLHDHVEWEFVPLVSRIFLAHRMARLALDRSTPDAFRRLAGLSWDGKADAERFAHLTYAEAVILSDAGAKLPDVAIETAADKRSVVVLRDMAAPNAPLLDDVPLLAWRMHHLLVVALYAGLVNGSASPAVFAWTLMALRPFVQYTRDADAKPVSDSRLTQVIITDDGQRWADKTGRTRYV